MTKLLARCAVVGGALFVLLSVFDSAHAQSISQLIHTLSCGLTTILTRRELLSGERSDGALC